jgi:hypothetical protein
MSDTRGFLQAIVDSLSKDEVKFGPKGKPKDTQRREGQARKKSEDEAYAALEEMED